jgi:hypothetical protein
MYASIPDFEELTYAIKAHFDVLRDPYKQWTDLARCAIQNVPYNSRHLVEVEAYINARRPALRKLVLVASEHFTEERLNELQRRAKISKYAWRSLKRSDPVTLKNGFTLLCY